MKKILCVLVAFGCVMIALSWAAVHLHLRCERLEGRLREESSGNNLEQRVAALETRLDDGETLFTEQLEEIERALEIVLKAIVRDREDQGLSTSLDEDLWNDISELIHQEVSKLSPDSIATGSMLRPFIRNIGRQIQDNLINQLALTTDLSEEQKEEVGRIFRERMVQIAEVWEQGGEPEEIRNRMFELREETDRRLEEVLDPEQFEKLKEMRPGRGGFFREGD